MPPVLAPGAWAGVNDSFLIARQKEQEQQRLAEGRQRMQVTQFDLQNAQQDRARRDAARGRAGQTLYGLAPPGMPGGGQQPPMPGTPSMPPQGPPQGGQPPQQPQMAPGVPQFSAPPQGRPPGAPPGMQPQGGAPGMLGAPTQPDPRMIEVARCKADIEGLQRELARPGLNDEQKSIINGELVKTQERMAQLTGQPAPYRSVPTGAPPQEGQPQGPQAGPMAPPPVGGQPAQQQQPNLLMQIISRAKEAGVPADGLMDVVDALSPVLKNQLQEELAALKGTQIAATAEFKMLSLGMQQLRDEVRARQGDRRLDQGDTRNEQNAERIAMAKKRAEAGEAPSTSELSNPDTARIYFDIYKATGKTPPFAWGKAGQADRATWEQIVTRLSKEDGVSGGELAGGQADVKANTAALVQNTKDLAAIRPYNDMLDKNATIAIDLAKKAQLSNSVWANKPIQWLRKNGGSDPNLREYLAQINIVSTEAARVLNNPRLVGQLTDSARHEMQEIIAGTMPLADTERVLRRMMADGSNRVKSLQDENKTLKAGASGKSKPAAGGDAATTNAKGWKLHVDGKGNKAYVSPDGTQFEEVK